MLNEIGRDALDLVVDCFHPAGQGQPGGQFIGGNRFQANALGRLGFGKSVPSLARGVGEMLVIGSRQHAIARPEEHKQLERLRLKGCHLQLGLQVARHALARAEEQTQAELLDDSAVGPVVLRDLPIGGVIAQGSVGCRGRSGGCCALGDDTFKPLDDPVVDVIRQSEQTVALDPPPGRAGPVASAFPSVQ